MLRKYDKGGSEIQLKNARESKEGRKKGKRKERKTKRR